MPAPQRAQPGSRWQSGWRSLIPVAVLALIPVSILALIAGAILALASAPSMAQDFESGVSTAPSAKLSTAPSPEYGAPALPKPEALFPDLFGLGATLRNHGVAVLLDNTNEFDGAVSGRHTGASNAGQYALEIDTDWDILAGIRGLQTHAVAVGRYGIPASRMFGDNLEPSQEIYGAGGNVAIHLVFAYAEETLAHGHFNLAFGRMPSLNDFSASPLYCNFQNNSLCGNPKASSDDTANSSYPDASWAVRLRVRPISQIYVQSGIYFSEKNIYNVTDGYRSGFRFSGAQINGEYFPVEIGWEPSFGPDKLPGHYKIGFGYDNGNHNDNYFDSNGAPFALTGLAPRVDHGQTQSWFLVDQMLVRQGPGGSDGVIALAGFYHNDPSVALRADEYFIAGLDRGFWKARPFDTIGVLFSYNTVSGKLGKTEALQQELGLPITGQGGSASPFYNDSTPGVQTHTMDLEVNYQIHVFRGVTFAPDFQYYFRPNAQSNLPDAALIGFKSHIELF